MSEFLEQVLPETGREGAVSEPASIQFPKAADGAVIDRAVFEHDRIHAALDALPEATYASAIEFSYAPSGLTLSLAPRCTRLVSSVCATRDLAELTQAAGDQPRALTWPGAAGLALPSRTFDLIVFTDVFAMMNDEYADRLADYALATLAPGGHVLLSHWLADPRAVLDGDEAAERFTARAGGALQPMLRRRMPHYRLDVLERPGRV